MYLSGLPPTTAAFEATVAAALEKKGYDSAEALKAFGWNNIINYINSHRLDWNGRDATVWTIPGLGFISWSGGEPGREGGISYADPISYTKWKADPSQPQYDYFWDGYSEPVKYQVSHGGISPDTLLIIAAIVITAGIASGIISGGALVGETAVEAAATVGVESAAESAAFDAWASAQGLAESTVSLDAFGGTVASWEGALTGVSTTATNAFANETAKFAQQQALAQSGTDLLSTSLPTIDLSSALSTTPNFSDIQKYASQASSAVSTISKVANVINKPDPLRPVTQSIVPVGRVPTTGLITGIDTQQYQDEHYLPYAAPSNQNAPLFIAAAGIVLLALLSKRKK